MNIRLILRWSRLLTILFFGSGFSSLADAGPGSFYGAPIPEEPCTGIGLLNGSCWTSSEADSAGVALFGPSRWRAGGSRQGLYGWSNVYVPYAGQWKLNAYLCASSQEIKWGVSIGNIKDRCGYAKAGWVIPSLRSVYLNTTQTVIDQGPDFGGSGISTTIPGNTTICYALVDSRQVVWASDAALSCQDGNKLPTTPSFCYMNNGNDITVDMGTLERNSIAKTPGTSAMINKNISMICSGSAEVNVKFKMNYIAVTVSSKQVVQAFNTSAHKPIPLGIAVSLDGTLMPPSTLSSRTYHFSPGYNDDLILEFEAVRDDKTELNDIPTGDFFASATLEMVQQ